MVQIIHVKTYSWQLLVAFAVVVVGVVAAVVVAANVAAVVVATVAFADLVVFAAAVATQ